MLSRINLDIGHIDLSIRCVFGSCHKPVVLVLFYQFLRNRISCDYRIAMNRTPFVVTVFRQVYIGCPSKGQFLRCNHTGDIQQFQFSSIPLAFCIGSQLQLISLLQFAVRFLRLCFIGK